MKTSDTVTVQPYWWVNQIMDFEHLEIMPCSVIDYDGDGKEVVGPCYSDEATFWAVYGHHCPWGKEGGVAAFEVFGTEAEAQRFYDLLTQLYPHLSERPVRPTFGARKTTIH